MEKPKPRSSPGARTNRGRPARKSSETQPPKDKEDDDTVLETYEQSPERPGGDERSNQATPDEPIPDREAATPD